MTIYILHHNRYWTEYVDFLLGSDNYQLVASRGALEGYGEKYPLEKLEPFDPDKHRTILTPGRLHDKSGDNRVIMRFMHSPGFYLYPLLRAYADLITSHKGCNYRFLLAEEYYKALIVKEIEDSALDHFRYLLLNDEKVSTLQVDVKMVEIAHAEKREERVEGSALLALTWLLIDNDFSRFLEIVETLNKRCHLSLLLHPLMRMDKNYMDKVLALEGIAYDKAYYNLSRKELVDLYDSHQFIVSDGSGSCYEAMTRGCLPYAVKDLRCVTADETFDERLDREYFPFPSYKKLGEKLFEENDSFLQCFFPYLSKVTYSEAVALATNEIEAIVW